LSKKPGDAKTLRLEAEAQLAHTPPTGAPAKSAVEVLHELQVHQIELEMQNEELRSAQIALEESRDRYAALYEFAPVGYLTLTRSGQISEINLTGATLLGLERNKLLQDRFDHLVSPEDYDRWYIFFASLMNFTEKNGIELALKRGDGTVFYAHLDCSRTETAGAEPELRMTLTDISAMHLNQQLLKAQDDLKEQLAFQTSLLESVPVPIFFKDCQGVYRGCNRAYEKAVNKSRAQIIGKSVFDTASPEIAEKYHAMDAELFGHPGKQVYEWVIQKPSGEIREVVFHKASFLRTDGSVGGLIGAVVDITDLKRKDAALLESEERLRVATESARDAIIIIEGESGTITAWNPAAEAVFGYTRAEALGQNLHDLLTPPRFRETSQQGLARFAKSGEGNVVGKTLELVALRKDRTEFPIELSLSAMKIHGKWLATGIARDITQRKQAEIALNHANRALATFSEVNRQLIFSSNETDLLQAICQTIVKHSGYCMASVGYATQDAGSTILIKAYADDKGGNYLGSMPLIRVDTENSVEPGSLAFRSGVTQVCQDIANDPQYLSWRKEALQHGYVSCITLPLRSSGVAEQQTRDNPVFGVLTVYSNEVNTFIPGEIALLEEMAEDLAYGVRTLRLQEERDRVLEQNKQHLTQMLGNLEDTVLAIAKIVEMRDPYTAGHQLRVAALAAAIARQMGLPDAQVHAIHLAGVLHDLGKIQIPAEILSKPGKLNTVEYSLIQFHPQVGYDILQGIKFPWPIAQMVLQHHERLDGSGYPQGLKGDAILLEARILAVSDVVEAISSHRPYRPALGIESALAEIEEGSGPKYDSAVVAACIKVLRDHDMKLPA
jgi:PAS domain S-box-containing protein/putative nucleotidyltransferase with HDIG domain